MKQIILIIWVFYNHFCYKLEPTLLYNKVFIHYHYWIGCSNNLMGPCNVVVHQIATVGSSSRSMRKWQSDQGWGLEEVHHPWWRRRGSTGSLGLDLVNYKRGDTFLFLIFFKVYILVCGGVHWREWWAVNLIPVVVAWRRRVRRLRESALCFRAQDKQKRERERERERE